MIPNKHPNDVVDFFLVSTYLYSEGFVLDTSRRAYHAMIKNSTLTFIDTKNPCLKSWRNNKNGNGYIRYSFNPVTGYVRRINKSNWNKAHPLNKGLTRHYIGKVYSWDRQQWEDGQRCDWLGYELTPNIGLSYGDLIRKYFHRMMNYGARSK